MGNQYPSLHLFAIVLATPNPIESDLLFILKSNAELAVDRLESLGNTIPRTHIRGSHLLSVERYVRRMHPRVVSLASRARLYVMEISLHILTTFLGPLHVRGIGVGKGYDRPPRARLDACQIVR